MGIVLVVSDALVRMIVSDPVMPGAFVPICFLFFAFFDLSTDRFIVCLYMRAEGFRRRRQRHYITLPVFYYDRHAGWVPLTSNVASAA